MPVGSRSVSQKVPPSGPTLTSRIAGSAARSGDVLFRARVPDRRKAWSADRRFRARRPRPLTPRLSAPITQFCGAPRPPRRRRDIGYCWPERDLRPPARGSTCGMPPARAGWWVPHDDATHHRPLSRPGGVGSLDELQQRRGGTAVLLFDLLSVVRLHAIERVSEALVAAVELLE